MSTLTIFGLEVRYDFMPLINIMGGPPQRVWIIININWVWLLEILNYDPIC